MRPPEPHQRTTGLLPDSHRRQNRVFGDPARASIALSVSSEWQLSAHNQTFDHVCPSPESGPSFGDCASVGAAAARAAAPVTKPRRPTNGPLILRLRRIPPKGCPMTRGGDQVPNRPDGGEPGASGFRQNGNVRLIIVIAAAEPFGGSRHSSSVA